MHIQWKIVFFEAVGLAAFLWAFFDGIFGMSRSRRALFQETVRSAGAGDQTQFDSLRAMLNLAKKANESDSERLRLLKRSLLSARRMSLCALIGLLAYIVSILLFVKVRA